LGDLTGQEFVFNGLGRGAAEKMRIIIDYGPRIAILTVGLPATPNCHRMVRVLVKS